MTPDFNQMSRREVEDYLIERSHVDPDFRKRLLSDPKTLLKELGLAVGADVEVRVLEEQPGTFYVVLPRALDDGSELDDEEIGSLSGGVRTNDIHRFFRGYC